MSKGEILFFETRIKPGEINEASATYSEPGGDTFPAGN